MDYHKLIDWLFERATLKPQIGFAGTDKRALLWIPGTKPLNPHRAQRIIPQAPIRGCTQLAFESITQPMVGQMVEVVWVGLDIDADDNPDLDLPTLCKCAPDTSMIRTSCSGEGVHVIYRLAKPILCRYELSNRVIKAITAPLVQIFKQQNIHVCKADRRMFWLDGGQNRIVTKSDYLIDPQIDASVMANDSFQKQGNSLTDISPVIADWAKRLGVPLQETTPIYVGDMVKLLRSMGEVVHTKSRMRGNGHTNGYVNISKYSISLFAYADGHIIWNFTDVGGLLNGNQN